MDEQPKSAADAPPETPPQRPTRGLWWVIVPALLGAAVGPLAGVLYAGAANVRAALPPDYPVESVYAQYGAMWGGGIGLALGALMWVCFPYKGAAPEPKPEAPPADEAPKPEATEPGAGDA
jgi:hypothetical protein